MIKRKKINPAGKIVLGFLTIIIIGTILLCLPVSSNEGKWLPLVDSLLTSTSSVCVTGLVVVDTAVYFSLFGQIVILLLIQIGGLGFITLTSLVFLLLGKKITYEKRMTIQESFNQENIQGMVKLIKKIIILVFSIEFIGFICLAPSMVNIYGWGSGLFKALFLSISAFCNAGHDILGTTSTQFTSLSAFAQNVFVLLPIMFLIVLGGLGYLVLFEIGKKFKKEKISLCSKIVLISTLILILGGAFVFACLEWNNPQTIGNMSFGEKILNSFFLSITPRTAGFTVFDFSNLTQPSIFLMEILMFIGGGPASTAGGIKTTTLIVLIVAVFKSANDNGNIQFCKRSISAKTVKKAFRVVAMAISFIVVSSFLISIFEGNAISVDKIFFECISAFSTVGLSLNTTALLGVASKVIITILMFVGRVGALTLTLALANKTNDISKNIEYPDSKIMVG